MDFVKIIFESDCYDYTDANCIKMYILGMFLAREVANDLSFFHEWLCDNTYTCLDGNTISLDKENEYILLKDMYSQEKIPTILKMSRCQFIQLLTDWEEKVINKKPKEVIIKWENDEFTIKTKD